ncbi:MAG TPA: CAP domain-containing protein [Pyrinomonadaceae bacterium]|jgi:uncharacterized protein YkwD
MKRRLCALTLPLLFVVCLVNPVQFPTQAQTGKPAGASNHSLSAFEAEMLREINLARTRPREYAAYLEQLRPYFKGKLYQQPGRPGLTTEEGAAALEDAINFMRAAKPLGPYDVSRGMCLGANVLVKDQGAKGLTGHRGTDGNFCEKRLEQFGAWQGTVGENLSYGKDTARERVLTWLIDDGVADRGHRNRLLSPDFKAVGVSCGDHAQLGTMCVLTFAGGFTDAAPGRTATRKF